MSKEHKLHLIRRHDATMRDVLRPLLAVVYKPCGEPAPRMMSEKLETLRALTDIRPHQRSAR